MELSCGLFAIKFRIYGLKEILSSLLRTYSKQLTRSCKSEERIALEPGKRGKKYFAVKDDRLRGRV